MLQPKRLKYRKKHRGRRKGKATAGNTVTQGEYGLKAMGVCWLTARQIEAGRVTMTRHLRRGGKVWVRVFPDMPVTKKPAEVRMGGGKANVEYWAAVVKPGKILYEVAGSDWESVKEAMRLASNKMPIPTKIVPRDPLSALRGG